MERGRRRSGLIMITIEYRISMEHILKANICTKVIKISNPRPENLE